MIALNSSTGITGIATTTVDEDGITAIPVNIPPIGFNRARISIQIDGSTQLDLIDLEVPAVVGIDPGHGGTHNVAGSNANNATASPSGRLEKAMTLQYARSLQSAFDHCASEQRLNPRIIMTRNTDDNVRGNIRAQFARNSGADVFFSIHFNSNNHSARGSETLVSDTNNINKGEDTELARRTLTAIINVMNSHDMNASDRGVKDEQWSQTKKRMIHNECPYLLDAAGSYNNTNTCHPIRGTIAEIEFIDVPTVDELLNTGPNATTIRAALSNAIRDAIIRNILIQPSQ